VIIKNNNTHIHFIGIGGIGMSALAEVSVQLGFKVSGSDLNESPNVEKLRGLGVKVYIGHMAENIKNASVIVFSSAIDKSNPEFAMALKEQTPILKRAELLADLMRLKQGIAVAGTHGKTTTTSIVASILKDAGVDPTYIIGGIVTNLGGHASVGKGEYLVAEADESDGSFLLLNSVYSIVTNIDDDHLDFYKTRENLDEAFYEFSNDIPFFGVCALNVEDEGLYKIAKKVSVPILTFSTEVFEEETDYKAINISQDDHGCTFEVLYKEKVFQGFKLALPGKHNILNALGAISVCHNIGLDFDVIIKGLKSFSGVGRRFQKIFSENNFRIIDDYGHHPTEILKTIKAAKEQGAGELVVLFEPHRYTRTKVCWNEFLHCFNDADRLLMAPIYAASEKEIPGITSENLAGDINKLHPELCQVFSDWSIVEETIKDLKSKNATFLVLGAGAVSKRVRDIVGSQ